MENLVPSDAAKEAGGSRDKINRVKRKIKRTLTKHEPAGALPAVHRAKTNQDEYEEFNASIVASPSDSPWESDDSCPSPEQRTITRRPPLGDERGPPVQTLFQVSGGGGGGGTEGGGTLVTATLPDGSTMTSPERMAKNLMRQLELGGHIQKD